MSSLSVQKVSNKEEFAALEGEWNALLRQSDSDTVALTFEWLSTWWDVFSEGRELCLLTAREGKELVGIAPLLRRQVRYFGIFSFRRLEFLASGEDEFDEICSDYLDIISAKNRESDVVDALVEYLLDTASNWDELLLTDVSGESKTLALLKSRMKQRGLVCQTTREQICIYVPLTDCDALRDGLRGPYKKNIPKDLKLAAREPARVRVQMIETEAEFDAGFETLRRLHQERWTSRGLPGSFASETFTRFHCQLAPLLLRNGWLKVWVLCVDEEAQCALYDFFYAGKVFYYQSGLGLKATLIRSPGTYLRYIGMQYACQQGYSEVDFLKGEADSYKFNWGAQTRPIVQVRFARRGLKESLYQATNRNVEALRPLKRKLQGALRRTPVQTDSSETTPASVTTDAKR